MVKIRESAPRHADGSIDIEGWIQVIAERSNNYDVRLIRNACILSQLSGAESTTFYGANCLQQGLAMAELLLELGMDQDSIAAAIVYDSTQYGDLTLQDVSDHLGLNITRLVEGVEKMDAIRGLHRKQDDQQRGHVDNLRKMLLAMVEDVRVVVIKLAERLCILRGIQDLSEVRQHSIAQETMDIYAPLANRLGIGQVKWEMEDLSFRYLEATAYREIAALVNETRISREDYIQDVQIKLEHMMADVGIKNADISGRAKHIYSIHRKMVRKKVGFQEIYDANAFRILVPEVDDCYEALSAVHTAWEHIPEEFDDYVTTPKPNGYRSIHTAVIGPNGKTIEIQIRTYQMHDESELGVAAHWQYKEGGKQKSSYQAKIAWLRQVLDWQQELTAQGEQNANQQHKDYFEDRVYVFTPAGDIVDLPLGSTPLDFAYNIHSEIGHRCRGAKVNGNIVPLTYQINTGEQIEVLTNREGKPSRDWLSNTAGYLKSARSKAKVHQWFKQQDYDRHFTEGQEILDRELKKINLSLQNNDIEKIAPKLNFKHGKDIIAAVGSGDLKFGQVVNAIAELHKDDIKQTDEVVLQRPRHDESRSANDIYIHGVDNLMSHVAKCCQPIPGEPIIGYITQNRGISIHRYDCSNMKAARRSREERLIEVQWGNETLSCYPVDLAITAYDRTGLLRDVTAILSNEKINLIALNTVSNKTENTVNLTLTLEIRNTEMLTRTIDKINALADIIEIVR